MSIFHTYIKKLYQSLRNSSIDYNLNAYRTILNEINRFQAGLASLGDHQLKEHAQSLRRQAEDEGDIDHLLPEAFALVREAIWRNLHVQPYDCQILGGIALHQGKLVEMQTGEGKTLMALFSAYLNALSGKGVHLFTFNDYLARRDAEWMGPVYEFLSLSVGVVYQGLTVAARQKAYRADVTYLTAKEAGFDYLRDTLCYHLKEKVHRPFHYTIIDEADSILIDEARVPMIIAGTSKADEVEADNEAQLLLQMADVARQLDPQDHIGFDRYTRTVHLTELGMRQAEALLNIHALYEDSDLHDLARLNCALYAEFLLQRDVDYIVQHGSVELVDEFTGRIADKRRWPDGIQEAIEAKEGLTIHAKGRILNAIALQYFLQLYPRGCG